MFKDFINLIFPIQCAGYSFALVQSKKLFAQSVGYSLNLRSKY